MELFELLSAPFLLGFVLGIAFTTAPDTDAVAASMAGWRAGRETEIRSGLGSGARAMPILAEAQK